MHYELAKCESCDLLFSTYVPELGGLIEDYARADFDSHRESRLAAVSYSEALGGFLNGSVKRLLDVGCGDGTFLLEAGKRGVEGLFGIEPSLAPHSSVADSIRDQVFLGPWESYPRTAPFDLVTLFQTIEHLTNPVDFMEFAHRSLEPGGKVAIASHNFRAPLNVLLGTKSPIFDVEHLQLFSPKAMTKLMEATGFRVIHTRSYQNRYPLSYLLRLSPLPQRMKVGRHASGTLSQITAPVRLGNLMTVGEKM